MVFRRLTKGDLKKIVEIQLQRVAKRLLEQGYSLEVTEDAKLYLAEVGYDPVYGARPLKRAIQRQLQDPLALMLIAGSFHPGDNLRVARGPEGLEFSATPAREPIEEPQPM